MGKPGESRSGRDVSADRVESRAPLSRRSPRAGTRRRRCPSTEPAEPPCQIDATSNPITRVIARSTMRSHSRTFLDRTFSPDRPATSSPAARPESPDPPDQPPSTGSPAARRLARFVRRAGGARGVPHQARGNRRGHPPPSPRVPRRRGRRGDRPTRRGDLLRAAPPPEPPQLRSQNPLHAESLVDHRSSRSRIRTDALRTPRRSLEPPRWP